MLRIGSLCIRHLPQHLTLPFPCTAQSLEAMLEAMRAQGYDLGPQAERIDGEAIVRALQGQEDQRTVLCGVKGVEAR